MKAVILIFVLIINSYSLTLKNSLEIALENSPLVSIASSQIRYNKHLKSEADSAYHPVLDVGFQRQELAQTGAFIYSPTHNYNLALKYNIFNGFSDSANIKSKQYEVESSKLEYATANADLKLSVVIAYTNYLKARKNIKVQMNQLSSLTKQYDDTLVRFEQGVIAKNELLLIDLDKLKAEQSVYKAKSNLRIVRSNLQKVIGVKIDDQEMIEDFNTTIPEVEDIYVLENEMMNNRSEVKALENKRLSVLSQKDVVQGRYLPRLDAEILHQINDKERRFNDSLVQPKDQTTFNINLQWNLYSGGSDEYKRRSLLERSTQINYKLDELKLELTNQLNKAYEDLKVAKNAKNVASRAKESAQENYRISSDKYRYGRIDALSLLVSQSNLTQAINAYNNAYYDVFIAFRTLARIVKE